MSRYETLYKMGFYRSDNGNLLFQAGGWSYKHDRGGSNTMFQSEGFTDKGKRVSWGDTKGTLIPEELLL